MQQPRFAWLGLAVALAGCQVAGPIRAPQADGRAVANAITGETLVRLKPGVSPDAFAARYGLRAAQRIGLGMYLFTGSTPLTELRADSRVLWAEPNRSLTLPAIQETRLPALTLHPEGSEDPLMPAQYGLTITGTDRAWKVQKGDPNVIVAVIDSGIDASHPEFDGQLVPGWDVTVKPAVPGGTHDGYGHGTHVAGIIGARADNGIGIAGVAPGCKLMPVRIFDDFGHSSEGTSAAAVIWAVDHGAKVINASWGSSLPGQAAMDAYQYALDHDVVFVSAVGNSGTNDQNFPAAMPGIIAVSGTTDMDTWASFSTWGDWVSVAAPGEGILSTFPMAKGNGYRIMRGTSMASPFVAGAAALVRSQFPNLKQAEVKARLEATAKDVIQPGRDPYSGAGRVDIARAVLDP
ncbi:MAG TPA: S8 family serine peptidase [Stenomitos sp.]